MTFKLTLHFLDIQGTLAKEEYKRAVDVPGKKQSTMIVLAWSLTVFETLTKQSNEFVNELSSFTLEMCNGQRGKVQKSLISFESRVLEYLHGCIQRKEHQHHTYLCLWSQMS